MPGSKIKITISLKDLATKGLNAVSSSVKTLGNSAKLATGLISAMSAAIGGISAAAIKEAVSAFASFDDVMRSVVAITGATAQESKALSDTMKELGATTKFSSVEAAQGAEVFARAGFSVKEIMEALPGAMSLASAAGTSLAQSVDIAASALRAYGKDASELPQINNVLVSAFTSTNSTIQELAEGFKYVAPIASGLGVSIEELVAPLAKLHDAGIKGSMAGTTLRGALSALLNPTAAEANILKQLGVNTKDTAGKFVGFASVIRQLENAGVSAEQALQLFGLRAGPGMAALIQSGSDSLAKFTAQLENVAGSDLANNMAKQLESGIGGAIRVLQSSWENLKISIGEGTAEAAKQAVENITDFVNQIQEHSQEIAELFNLAIEAFGAFGGMVGDGAKIISGDFDTILDATSFLVAGIKELPLSVQEAFGKIELVVNSLIGTFLEAKKSIALIMLDTEGVMQADRLIDGALKHRQEIEKTISAIQAEKTAIEDATAAALSEAHKRIEAKRQEVTEAKKAETETLNAVKVAEQEKTNIEKKRIATKKQTLKGVLAAVKTEIALEKAEYSKQIAHIEALEKQGVISHKKAQELKKQAELDFLRFKVSEAQKAVQQAIAEYGEESQQYKNTRAAMIQAEADLQAAITRTTDAVQQQAKETVQSVQAATEQVSKLAEASAAAAAASSGGGSSLSGKKIASSVISRDTAMGRSMAWLSQKKTLAQQQIRHSAFDILQLDKEYANMRKTVKALGGDLTGLWETPLNDIRKYIQELRSANLKNREINIDFTGTGSTKRPLSLKIAEMSQKINDFTRLASQEVAKNINMTGISQGFKAPAASVQGFKMSDLGKTDLVFQGKRYSVFGNQDVIREMQKAIKREQRVLP